MTDRKMSEEAVVLRDFGVSVIRVRQKVEMLYGFDAVGNASVTNPLHMAMVHLDEATDAVARLLGNQILHEQFPDDPQPK